MFNQAELPTDIQFFPIKNAGGFGYGKSKTQTFTLLVVMVLLLFVGGSKVLKWKVKSGMSDGTFVQLFVVSLLVLVLGICLSIFGSKKKTDYFKAIAVQNSGREFALSGKKFYLSTGEFMRSTNNLILYGLYGNKAFAERAEYLEIDLSKAKRVALNNKIGRAHV